MAQKKIKIDFRPMRRQARIDFRSGMDSRDVAFVIDHALSGHGPITLNARLRFEGKPLSTQLERCRKLTRLGFFAMESDKEHETFHLTGKADHLALSGMRNWVIAT